MKNYIALAASCLAAFMFALEISSIPVVLPTLGKDLQMNFVGMQWVVNAYLIACTAVLMAAGALADHFGRKRIFLSALILFGIASLGCGTAQHTSELVLFRILQGAGGGAALICLTAVLSHQFREKQERARAFGIWGIVFGAGLGLGPIVGGTIASLTNWRWVFLVHVPLSMLTVILVIRTVRESRNSEAQRLDIGGIGFLSLTMLGLISFIMEGPQVGFGNAIILSIGVATILGAVAFIFIERLHPHPMFDFSVFAIPRFSGAILGSAGINFSFWPLMIYVPTYFQNTLGYDKLTTGFILLSYTLPVFMLPPLGEHLALRYQPGIIIPVGLLVTGLGCVAMLWGVTAQPPSWLTLLPGCVLAGAGVGLANTTMTNTATGAVPPNRAGMASSIDAAIRLIAMATNIALMGLILLEGVRSSLLRSLTADSSRSRVNAIADGLLGDGFSTNGAEEKIEAIYHAALQQGFELITIYAGSCAFFFAVLSYCALRSKRCSRSQRLEIASPNA